MYKIQESLVESIADRECKRSDENATTILAKICRLFDPKKEYDIFLSHSYKDAKLILGIKLFIETEILFFKKHLAVYVDWIEDSDLNRSNVNINTARRLKLRMNKSRCLFFIESEHSPNSRWMPWELGYFDGYKNKVAVLQLTQNDIEKSDKFSGCEYLNLYPTVGRKCSELYIYENDKEINLANWI